MEDQTHQNEGFVGRHEELQTLFRRVREAGTAAGESLILAGNRGVGKSALLRQLAAHLFWKQDRVVPFLYAANAAVLDSADFARDYLAVFLRHRIAFENRDQTLLSREGISLRELSERAGSQGTAWVWDILERVRNCADDPLALLKTALHAPALSAAETGKPVVVLFDDFPMLARLRRGAVEEPSLLSLFNGPIAAKQTLHILSGNPSALREIPLPVLTEVPLQPLPPHDAEQLFRAAMHARGASFESLPSSLAGHLGGNPLYIHRVAGALPQGATAGDEAFWTAYVQEITGGGLYRYFATMLMALFPAWDERRNALEVLHRIFMAGKGAPVSGAVHGFIAEKLSREAFRALLRSGFVYGEFGGYRAPDDAILRDVITFLFEREIAGKPLNEIVRTALNRRYLEPSAAQGWDLTVPLEPRSELVVAESLEQIGKNLNIAEETIRELQMAVIEACINAIEHTKGGDRRLYVSVGSHPDRLEVSIESPGQEFVQAETGEPFLGTEVREGPPRGQGIRLMKRFADTVRFDTGSHGRRVVLVKYLSRPVTSEKEGVSHRE